MNNETVFSNFPDTWIGFCLDSSIFTNFHGLIHWILECILDYFIDFWIIFILYWISRLFWISGSRFVDSLQSVPDFFSLQTPRTN